MQMDTRTHTHTHTHTQHNNLLTPLITVCCLRCRLWFFPSIKSIKNSRNMDCCVHYFIPSAFICVLGLFFIQSLQVKLCKAYLAIKHRTSLTSFLASSFAGTPLLASFFPSSGPFSASPCLFLSDWPSQWGYRAPTCLHLPPTSAAQGSVALRVPPFPLRYSPGVSVFSTFDPRPWQQEQECQE